MEFQARFGIQLPMGINLGECDVPNCPAALIKNNEK